MLNELRKAAAVERLGRAEMQCAMWAASLLLLCHVTTSGALLTETQTDLSRFGGALPKEEIGAVRFLEVSAALCSHSLPLMKSITLIFTS